MFEHAWQIGLLIGTVVLYVLLVLQYPRARKEGENTREGPVTDQADATGVVCPECGTTNEEGYRRCRSCVSELPQFVDVDRGGSATVVRNTR